MVRIDGELVAVDWPTALSACATALRDSVDNHGAKSIGALASSQATLEEQYLLQKLMRALGSNNVDHRLTQTDFSDQNRAPVMPWLGMAIEDLEKVDAALLIGSNIRKEQPLAGLRLRKASLRGAKISLLNPRHYDMNFDTLENIGASPANMVLHLLAVAVACGCKDDVIEKIAAQANVDDSHRAIAASLKDADDAVLLLGNSAVMHSNYSALRALASCIAKATGATLGYLPEGGNTAGAWLAGCVPHRTAGGVATDKTGLNAAEIVAAPLKAVLIFGCEPRYEQIHSAQARQQLKNAHTTIISTHLSKHAVDHADVVLPTAAFAETAGTFVNAAGVWQMFNGSVAPPGDGRPAWKVLRVLGNELELSGFEYSSVTEIRDELKTLCRDIELNNDYTADNIEVPEAPSIAHGLLRCGDLPAYKSDMLVRRAKSLQKTADAQQSAVMLNTIDMTALGLEEGAVVNLEQGGDTVMLKAVGDDGVPEGCAWLPIGSMDLAGFGALFEPVAILPGS